MGAVSLRLLTVAALWPAAVQAHDGSASHAGAWSLPWSFEPWIIACLAVSGALYAVGLARLWAHAGAGRGVGRRHAAAFTGGWLVMVLALVSPIDPLGERLFSAHMLQHELLMVVAAPLMVMSRPLAVWVWALSPRARRAVGGAFHHPAWRTPWQCLTAPLAAWVVHAAALWLWHVPAWFEAALAHSGLHSLQHASFLFSALLFWWSVLRPAAPSAGGAALLSAFTTMMHSGALGALLALSPLVWYPSYVDSATALGWDPLDDQQLGGLLMWAPAGLAYLAAGLALVWPWLKERAGGHAPPITLHHRGE
jgi:cytochrome c oxidase assembly factor CtaG